MLPVTTLARVKSAALSRWAARFSPRFGMSRSRGDTLPASSELMRGAFAGLFCGQASSAWSAVGAEAAGIQTAFLGSVIPVVWSLLAGLAFFVSRGICSMRNLVLCGTLSVALGLLILLFQLSMSPDF